MKIERFSEVFVVARAPSHFAFCPLPVRAQSNRLLPRLALFRLHDQIQSAAVGQLDIAYQDVKPQVVEQVEAVRQIRRRRNLMTAMGE